MAQNFNFLKALANADDRRERTPDTFREALLSALGAPAAAALAHSFSPALRWMIEQWPRLILTVPLEAGGAPGPLLARVQAAKRQIQQREAGLQPITLVLKQRGEEPPEDILWSIFFTALADAGPALRSPALRLELSVITPALLSYAGQALTGLQSLTVGAEDAPAGCEVQFPPPSLQVTHGQVQPLASLRHLIIHSVAADSQDAMWPSVAPHMSQLVSVSIGPQPRKSTEQNWQVAEGARYRRPLWVAAFSNVSHTLTRVSLPTRLHPWLIRLLQTSAPVRASYVTHTWLMLTSSAVAQRAQPSAVGYNDGPTPLARPATADKCTGEKGHARALCKQARYKTIHASYTYLTKFCALLYARTVCKSWLWAACRVPARSRAVLPMSHQCAHGHASDSTRDGTQCSSLAGCPCRPHQVVWLLSRP